MSQVLHHHQVLHQAFSSYSIDQLCMHSLGTDDGHDGSDCGGTVLQLSNASDRGKIVCARNKQKSMLIYLR